jgi:hypothetical protein
MEIVQQELFTIPDNVLSHPCFHMIQPFRSGQPSHDVDHKAFELMTSTLPLGTIDYVASLLA